MKKWPKIGDGTPRGFVPTVISVEKMQFGAELGSDFYVYHRNMNISTQENACGTILGVWKIDLKSVMVYLGVLVEDNISWKNAFCCGIMSQFRHQS